MVKTYVPERQSEYWTSREIEQYFENCGIDVYTIPVPQKIENIIPADFIFIPEQKIKLFGLQYKALYYDASGDFWKLDNQQHITLQKYSWIYYGLSELKIRKYKRNCLHLLKIFDPHKITFPTGGKFKPQNEIYYRWGGFFKMLENCKCGKRINTLDELKNELSGEYQEIASDINLFLHNFDTGVTVNVNRLLNFGEGYINNEYLD